MRIIGLMRQKPIATAPCGTNPQGAEDCLPLEGPDAFSVIPSEVEGSLFRKKFVLLPDFVYI